MSTQSSSSVTLASSVEASGVLAAFYPNFRIVAPPVGSGATRAWRGTVCPLPGDSNLGAVAAGLQFDHSVDVGYRGELQHASDCKRIHPAFGALAKLERMNVEFELLVLEFEKPKHPQVFCLNPRINRQNFPSHPHLRDDQRIYTPALCQALCVYLASDHVYPNSYELHTLLDFTSIWLGKHLIWQRTSTWTCFQHEISPSSVYTPTDGYGCQLWSSPEWMGLGLPQELGYVRTDVEDPTIEQFVTRIANNRHYSHGWRGEWLGPSAPHTAHELLRTVSPKAECTCGSGTKYYQCCLAKHEMLVKESRR